MFLLIGLFIYFTYFSLLYPVTAKRLCLVLVIPNATRDSRLKTVGYVV